MKALFVLVSALILSTSGFAAERTIELNSKKVIVGKLDQARGQAAQATLEVVRTSETPDLVELVFNFKQGDYVCTEYRTRTVYEPGYYRVVCNTDRYGRQYCRRIYTGGYYRTYEECVRNEYRLFDDARVLKLNFKKAANLLQVSAKHLLLTSLSVELIQAVSTTQRLLTMLLMTSHSAHS